MAKWRTEFQPCCKDTLTDMANLIDQCENCPDQAQFLRTLKGLSVEEAQKKLVPPDPQQPEWWEALRGICASVADRLYQRTMSELPGQFCCGGCSWCTPPQGERQCVTVGHAHDPYKAFWSELCKQMGTLYQSERTRESEQGTEESCPAMESRGAGIGVDGPLF